MCTLLLRCFRCLPGNAQGSPKSPRAALQPPPSLGQHLARSLSHEGGGADREHGHGSQETPNELRLVLGPPSPCPGGGEEEPLLSPVARLPQGVGPTHVHRGAKDVVQEEADPGPWKSEAL